MNYQTASEFNAEIPRRTPVIYTDDAGKRIANVTTSVAKIARERGPVVAVACRSGYVSINKVEKK